jgi:hypothetical protein
MEDTMEQARGYEFERRISTSENDITNMKTSMSDLRDQIKDEQTEIKDAIKDLAISQTNQAVSMAKIESSISTLAKGLGIGLPLVVAIVAGGWTYTTYQSSQIEKAKTEIYLNHDKSETK